MTFEEFKVGIFERIFNINYIWMLFAEINNLVELLYQDLNLDFKYIHVQKQPSIGVLRKRFFEIMHQTYRRTL